MLSPSSPGLDKCTDSVLIVYPQERFGREAIQRFAACGLSLETLDPPADLRDVACPAVKVSRSLFGRVQEVSEEEDLFHIGIVDSRPPLPDTEPIARFDPGPELPLLETVQITFIAACMTDQTRLRFIAQFNQDISQVFPYLNTTLKGAVYTPSYPTLGFSLEHRMVTLYGTRLAVGKTDEIVDTWRTMARVKDLVNRTWARRDTIEPCMEERSRPPHVQPAARGHAGGPF